MLFRMLGGAEGVRAAVRPARNPRSCCLLQAESSGRLKAMEQQLAALRQQHDKAMKEAEACHKNEVHEARLRTAKVGREAAELWWVLICWASLVSCGADTQHSALGQRLY